MEIDEGRLQDLLYRRKRYIRSSRDIIEALTALVCYVVTVIFTFHSVREITLLEKIAGILMLIIYIVILCAAVYNSRYSVEAFLRDIIACGNDHVFSLLVIKDSRGRFLLKKDRRWKTYLFPYVRTREDGDADSVREFVRETMGLSSVEIREIKEADFTKRSVSANMTKSYHHTFYRLGYDAGQLPEKDRFKINGTVYRWFSIDDMKDSRDMMLKNRENVSFVESHF